MSNDDFLAKRLVPIEEEKDATMGMDRANGRNSAAL
jgi:hypothetical protein